MINIIIAVIIVLISFFISNKIKGELTVDMIECKNPEYVMFLLLCLVFGGVMYWIFVIIDIFKSIVGYLMV